MEADTPSGGTEASGITVELPEVHVNGAVFEDIEGDDQDEPNNHLQEEVVDISKMLYVQGSKLCADLGDLKMPQIPDQVFDLDELVCLCLHNNKITEVRDPGSSEVDGEGYWNSLVFHWSVVHGEIQSFHWLLIPQRIKHKINTLL